MSDASSKPDRYAVMGHPIDHSWSPFIHGMFARQTSQNLTYRLLDVPPDKFRASALEFFTSGGRGLNVTVPHKPAAAEFVNRLTARAETAGAVNTILVESNGELMGDNTDGVGLITDLTANLWAANRGSQNPDTWGRRGDARRPRTALDARPAT